MLAVILLAMLNAGPGLASTTIWDESIDGDLPADFNAGPLLPLTLGQNQVFGEVEALADPADGFRFEFIPALELMDVVITNDGPDLVTFLYFPEGGIDTLTIEILPQANASLFTETPTSGEPVNEVSPGIHGIQMKTPGDQAYSVTFIFTPEPSTWLLATLAFIYVGLYRRI